VSISHLDRRLAAAGAAEPLLDPEIAGARA